MSTAQHGHDGKQVVCVDFQLWCTVLLIYLGVLSIITFPVSSVLLVLNCIYLYYVKV